MAKYRSWVEGLKFADFPNAVRKLAIDLDLDCTISVDSGIFRETTYFTVEGDSENIDKLKRYIRIGTEEYNSR